MQREKREKRENSERGQEQGPPETPAASSAAKFVPQAAAVSGPGRKTKTTVSALGAPVLLRIFFPDLLRNLSLPSPFLLPKHTSCEAFCTIATMFKR